jgi:hypothetical protein
VEPFSPPRLRLTISNLIISTCLLGLNVGVGRAQLTDITQTTPQVSGGTIGKSLEGQIGAGQGDAFTPGSSIYLIKRDPARAIRRGRQLFQRKFTANQGLGPRVTDEAAGNIQSHPEFGAGLVDSCAGCHGRPRGSAGVGGNVATRPDSRDAPHLFGLGLVEMLADDITQDLRAIRQDALAQAQASGAAVTLSLESKGIHFGAITAHPDATVDTLQVEGIDPDLRVRPFFAQGGTISMREFIIGGFKAEMGLQAPDAILCAVTDPVNPQRMISPAGFVFDPAQDTFERPPVCEVSEDGDGDGVVNEIDPALIDYLEFYLLNYLKPGRGRIDSAVEQGLELFEDLGCPSCHIQNLTLNGDRRIADVETRFDPQRGIFNRLFAEVIPLFEILEDEEPFPQLLPQGEPFVVQNIFTDFKRHDLGPWFHERNYDGSVQTEFITEPLWGVGTTAPYGHDGRSMNLEEVIVRHGGEAESSRQGFMQLPREQQRLVIEFLQSLVLFPPDDTASTLNPGVFGGDPQTEHGSINLGALFQIADEGPE